MSETRVHEAQIVALKATKACPKCDGLCEQMRKPPDASQGRPQGIPCRCAAFSDGCDGTGRVPILDAPTPEHPQGEHGLRVRCIGRSRCSDRQCGDSTWDHECDLGGHDEHCCGRLGYTPSDDFWAWLDALEDLNSDETVVRIDSLMYNVLAYQERKLAFYTAIVEAVTA